MDQLGFSLTVQRGLDGAKAGQRPGPESSILKITGTELNQRRQELLVALRGPQALGWEGAGFEAEELSERAIGCALVVTRSRAGRARSSSISSRNRC